MKLLIFRERGQDRALEPVLEDGVPVVVTLPDTTTNPEATAWAQWSRGRSLPRADYAVVRAGQRFTVTESKQTVSKANGGMA